MIPFLLFVTCTAVVSRYLILIVLGAVQTNSKEMAPAPTSLQYKHKPRENNWMGVHKQGNNETILMISCGHVEKQPFHICGKYPWKGVSCDGFSGGKYPRVGLSGNI